MKKKVRISDISIWMQLCILIGYPFIATLGTIMPSIADQLVVVFRAVVVLLALVLFVLAFGKSRGTAGWYLILSFLGLYLMRLMFDLISGSDAKTLNSIIIYVGFVLVPVVSVLAFNLTQENDKKLALMLSKFGLVLLLALCLIQLSGGAYNPWEQYGERTYRLGLEKLNPITIGQVAVTVLLAGNVLLIHYRVKGLVRILAYVSIALALIVLILANSRGPVISGTAALLWIYFGRIRRAWFIMALMATGFASLLIWTDVMQNVVDRFDFDMYENRSNYERLIVQYSAIEAFLSAPFFGAFATNPSFPPGNYPHNLFIETAMAMGIVGLVLLAAIFIYALRRIFSFYNAQHPLLAALLVHYTLALQFSGSLTAADSFMMLIGFAVVTNRLRSEFVIQGKNLLISRKILVG